MNTSHCLSGRETFIMNSKTFLYGTLTNLTARNFNHIHHSLLRFFSTERSSFSNCRIDESPASQISRYKLTTTCLHIVPAQDRQHRRRSSGDDVPIGARSNCRAYGQDGLATPTAGPKPCSSFHDPTAPSLIEDEQVPHLKPPQAGNQRVIGDKAAESCRGDIMRFVRQQPAGGH